MNMESTHNIRADWQNVYYDRKSQSIDFYSETDSLFVNGIDPATFIRAFRNAVCAGCGCEKLQDMDLPEHAKESLRDIISALSSWDTEDMRKTVVEAEMKDINRRHFAEPIAAAQL